MTSAAAVMVAVFAIFASLRTLDIKQLGVGLAVAVLLDATVIRGVLLPAAMKLLGDWNWYLPRWLQWLPRLRLEAELDDVAVEAPRAGSSRTHGLNPGLVRAGYPRGACPQLLPPFLRTAPS